MWINAYCCGHATNPLHASFKQRQKLTIFLSGERERETEPGRKLKNGQKTRLIQFDEGGGGVSLP